MELKPNSLAKKQDFSEFITSLQDDGSNKDALSAIEGMQAYEELSKQKSITAKNGAIQWARQFTSKDGKTIRRRGHFASPDQLNEAQDQDREKYCAESLAATSRDSLDIRSLAQEARRVRELGDKTTLLNIEDEIQERIIAHARERNWDAITVDDALQYVIGSIYGKENSLESTHPGDEAEATIQPHIPVDVDNVRKEVEAAIAKDDLPAPVESAKEANDDILPHKPMSSSDIEYIRRLAVGAAASGYLSDMQDTHSEIAELIAAYASNDTFGNERTKTVQELHGINNRLQRMIESAENVLTPGVRKNSFIPIRVDASDQKEAPRSGFIDTIKSAAAVVSIRNVFSRKNRTDITPVKDVAQKGEAKTSWRRRVGRAVGSTAAALVVFVASGDQLSDNESLNVAYNNDTRSEVTSSLGERDDDTEGKEDAPIIVPTQEVAEPTPTATATTEAPEAPPTIVPIEETPQPVVTEASEPEEEVTDMPADVDSDPTPKRRISHTELIENAPQDTQGEEKTEEADTMRVPELPVQAGGGLVDMIRMHRPDLTLEQAYEVYLSLVEQYESDGALPILQRGETYLISEKRGFGVRHPGEEEARMVIAQFTPEAYAVVMAWLPQEPATT